MRVVSKFRIINRALLAKMNFFKFKSVTCGEESCEIYAQYQNLNLLPQIQNSNLVG
jgi:hypothetical protein